MTWPAWQRPIIEPTELTSCTPVLTHVRRELASLQSAYQTERVEGDKVRQLLAYEETRRCNLEEILDQVHKHAKDQRRNLQNKVPILSHCNTHHRFCTVHLSLNRLLVAVPFVCSILQRLSQTMMAKANVSTAVDDLQLPCWVQCHSLKTNMRKAADCLCAAHIRLRNWFWQNAGGTAAARVH